jgi:nitrite reductase/ring-hydroxylating ferredoxin subunit
MRYEVCSADDMEPGEVRCVRAGNLELALARDFSGRIHALRNICPHQHAPLSDGRIRNPSMADDIGDLHIDRARFVLQCPYHRYEYDVETGRSLANPTRLRVKRYQVTVESGKVLVDV